MHGVAVEQIHIANSIPTIIEYITLFDFSSAIIRNGLYDVIQHECLQITTLLFLSNCFIAIVFLKMIYD